MTQMMFTIMVSACLLSSSQDDGRKTKSNQADMLRAVADAYDENRNAFTFGTVEFDYTDGLAADIEAAKRGDLRDAHTASGVFHFDGKDAYYSRVFSLADLEATTIVLGERRSSCRLDPRRMLTNGKQTLTEVSALARVNANGIAYGRRLSAGSNDFFQFVEIPLDLGRPDFQRHDLARSIRAALDGKDGARVEGADDSTVLEGIKTVQVALALKYGKRTCWVDLDRGAVPLRIVDAVPGNPGIERHYGDLRKVEGRGWLPFSMTTFVNGGQVKRITIKNADFRQAPPRSAFRMEFDTPYMLVDMEAGLTYAKLKVVDLNNLPDRSSPDVITFDKNKVKVVPPPR